MPSDKSSLPVGFDKNLADKGTSLSSIGIQETAWRWADAISIINELASRGHAILGGDVYEVRGEAPRPTIDSWGIDWDPSSSTWEQYVQASKDKAVSYIQRYRAETQHEDPDGEEYLYVIVWASRDRYERL